MNSQPRSFDRLTGAVARVCALAACALALAMPAGAQGSSAAAPLELGARRPEVTRPELEAMAAAAERENRTDEATTFRARLRDGDFFPGDRFILMVQGGEKTFADTVVVAAGQTISLEGYPDIPLRGVLRSELRDHLTRELGRYVKAPVIGARPLLRLTLTGGVGRPGFYVVPTDAAVTDIIMQAGGPVQNTLLDKSVIRRADAVVIDAKTLQTAIRSGLTVDQLGLRAGDVIDVGQKKQHNISAIAQIVTLSVSVLGLVIGLTRSR